jgi:hypothetical protein
MLDSPIYLLDFDLFQPEAYLKILTEKDDYEKITVTQDECKELKRELMQYTDS